jgi:caffeoyl-CoA O-methyltransferase
MTVISEPGSPRPVTPASILASKLDELARLLEAQGCLDPVSRERLQEVCELASGLDPYLGRFTSPESAELHRLADRTQAEDWRGRSPSGVTGQLEQEMLSGHVEGQLLKMLVHATRATRVLEIGMFTGYSALAMAEAMPTRGQVIACEIDAEVAAFAQSCFDDSPVGEKITIRVGPALDTLGALAETGRQFDLVFIDADKAGYAGYLNALLDKGLLAPHALICVDNTLMQGQPWLSSAASPNGVAIAEFNELVAADPRVEQVIIPLRDGLTLIRQVES